MSARLKEISTVLLVTEALRKADDFMTRAMIEKATGKKANAVSGALVHLRKARVADVIVDPDGKGWWFALPPEEDARLRTCDEHVPHPHGIKRRRRNKKQETQL